MKDLDMFSEEAEKETDKFESIKFDESEHKKALMQKKA